MMGFVDNQNWEAKKVARLLFCIGLFASTKVHLVGSIAISELLMIVMFPFVLFKEWPTLRRYGFVPLLYLLILWIVGAVCSDLYNHTYIIYAIKGWATPVVYFVSVVVIFSLLRKNFDGYKWMLLGFAISQVISTFVFSRASSIGMEEYSENALDKTIEYKLYWITMLSTWLLLPIKGWYQKTPMWYALAVTFGVSIYALLTGARSLFMSFMVSFVLLAWANKSRFAMKRLTKNFVMVVIVLGLALYGGKLAYKSAVKSGFLGTSELHKYEKQTAKGDSVIKLLMAGRAEFFVDIFAAIDRPWLGRGSWALDWDYIYPEFVAKYGDVSDQNRMERLMMQNSTLWRIPAHSHIATYWMWHGVGALLFWLYYGWIIISTLTRRLHIIPECYGYLVLVLPAFLWDWLFTPCGHRIQESLMLVVCLLVRYQANLIKRGVAV